jgi:exosortase
MTEETEIAIAQTEGGPLVQVQGNVAVWLPWLVLVGLFITLYGHVFVELADDWWNDPNASHGLLVPPLAGYIAWRRKNLTLRIPAVPDARGLFWIAGGCLVLLTGKLGAEYFLTRISIVIILTGLVQTFWGMQRLRTLAFPLLLLATMVPLPVIVFNSLAQPLQLFASGASANVAQFFGTSVFQDGNTIQLASTTLGVEEACSGLRSLAALAVMALLLGFLQCERQITRVILFAMAFPIAVFVNVIRVSGTAIMADHDPELAMGFYHTFSGWLVFLLGIFFVLGASRLLHTSLDRGR